MAYAVEITCSTAQEDDPDTVPRPEAVKLEEVVLDRVSQNVKNIFNPVLENQENPVSKRSPSNIDSFPEHLHGVYRFSDTDNLALIVEKVRDEVVADAEWFTIRVHSCDHDKPDSQRTGCENWKTEKTKGAVPEEV